MGGSALKNVTTRRYAKDEFFQATCEVYNLLDYNTEWQCEVVPAYRNKESFGDLDIVVINPIGDNPVEVVRRVFSPDEVVRDGNTVSFNYNDLQVDLIFTPAWGKEFAISYFSYNDLGNFIGRTAHRLGFKFGHDGLWYVYRDPDDDAFVVRRLPVTRSFMAAMMFLGFDYSRWSTGFNTPEDIFEYAASSCYFDPAQFLLHNRASASRRRDRTRKMYNLMLDWIKKKYPALNDTSPTTKVDRDEHLKRAMCYFPQFAEDYAGVEMELARSKKLKANFNGHNYMEWFGVEGKELGDLMSRHRGYFAEHNLLDWLGSVPLDSFKVVIQEINLLLEKTND